jgi:zinc protease
VKREKGIQLAAIKAEADRLTSVAFRELRETLFGSHPFAWDRNGSPATLAGIDSARILAFHRNLATARNMVLAVYGDVDAAVAVRLAEEAFGGMPSGRRHQTPAKIGFAANLSGRVVREVRKDKKQAVLAVGFPTVAALHKDRAALELIDEACSDMASRLFLRIREEQGLAYYTGAFQILGMAPGAFTFYLGTSPAQLDHAQSELLDEIASLAAGGLEEEELIRVKKSWTGKNLISRQSPESLARTAALDELYGVGHDHHEKFVERVQALTVAEVRSVARRYFGPNRPHVVARVLPG